MWISCSCLGVDNGCCHPCSYLVLPVASLRISVDSQRMVSNGPEADRGWSHEYLPCASSLAVPPSISYLL